MFVHPNFSDPLTIKKNSVWRPAIEVKQNEQEYKIKVQLPGVKKDEINVELDNDFMTVSAEIKEEKEEQEEKENNEKYHTCEFRYGRYQRTISFDHPVKYEEAEAKYEDGILCIKIPKQDIEEHKPKKLEIN